MININKELCIGCGACVSLCPEGFEINNGKAKLKNPEAKCIQDAINICPVNAIK